MNERFDQEITSVAEISGGVGMLTERGANSAVQGEGKLTICAWCRRLHLWKDRWVDVDAVPLEMADQITHGVCPDCFNDFLGSRPQTGASSIPADTTFQPAPEPEVRPWWLSDSD